MNTLNKIFVSILASVLLMLCACHREIIPPSDQLQIIKVMVGSDNLSPSQITEKLAVDQAFSLKFSGAVDRNSAAEEIYIELNDGSTVSASVSFSDLDFNVILSPLEKLNYHSDYKLIVTENLTGAGSETFPGIEYLFTTITEELKIIGLSLNGQTFPGSGTTANISRKNIEFVIDFSEPLDPEDYSSFFMLTGDIPLHIDLSQNHQTVTLKNQSYLKGYTKYYLIVSSNLTALSNNLFQGFNSSFYTELDSTYKFPQLSDDELLDLVQSQTFRYFWDFGHPESGLARERNTSGDIVTIGGSGFGVMAMIAGIERNFITRTEGLQRLDKILGFLESCDRFHGAWPHWLNGKTGEVIPFSQQDNGGDLVETAFMIQGLLTFRQYLDSTQTDENSLKIRIDTLWHQVEWDWYTNGQNVLYWHWSPNYNFNMNHQIRGHNETLITYILAASSPSHPVSQEAYHQGYASNGSIVNNRSYFGIRLPLGGDYGGPLFFAHYSFLGLDPRNLNDEYGNYWEQNVNHSLINQAWCVANPKKFIGYSSDCWGLTASDNSTGYSAHSPTNDRGVISPTAAISSLPYSPEKSMKAIRHFYYLLGDQLWGDYGFYDAFDVRSGWWASSYLAIDQGPQIVMIENYRTALLWKLFMTSPEIQTGLSKLGFTY